MKKTLIVLILLLAAVSAFALNAKVLDVVGKVEYQANDGSWQPVSVGMILGPGTVLSTGFKSETVISIDETTLTVKALTRLTIEKLYEQDGNKSSSFYLDAGALAADVQSADQKRVSFAVKTPAVTASVRGTAGDLTVSTIVGTKGTWLLSPPQPKAISYNRGDAVLVAEEAGPVADVPVAAAAPEAAAGAAPSDAADEFAWGVENGEVTIQPGQAASFEQGKDIVTPMQTAAAAATSIGGTQTLSSQEAVSSSAAPTVTSAASTVLADVLPVESSPKTKTATKGSISIRLTWPEFN